MKANHQTDIRDSTQKSAEDSSKIERSSVTPGGYSSIENPWGHLCLWIAISGGWYPVFVLTGGWLVSILANLFTVQAALLLAIFPFAFGFCFVAFFIGSTYAGLLAIPALAVVYAIVRSLNWRPSWTQRGLFCGGLVAYLCLLPVSWEYSNSLIYEVDWRPGEGNFVPYALFVLAILVGLIGGGKAGLEIDRDQAGAVSKPQKQFRYNTWQLLAAMSVVSLLLTGMRIIGLLNAPMLGVTGAWIATHFLLKRPALYLATRWVDRHERRLQKRANRIAQELPERNYDPAETQLAEWLETREQEQRSQQE